MPVKGHVGALKTLDICNRMSGAVLSCDYIYGLVMQEQ